MSVRFGYNYLKCFQFEGQAGPLEKKVDCFLKLTHGFLQKKVSLKN